MQPSPALFNSISAPASASTEMQALFVLRFQVPEAITYKVNDAATYKVNDAAVDMKIDGLDMKVHARAID
jgi:hypothetical protein